ncbi:MAG: FAD-binding oxidoreductase [Myxococcota bacterium]
MSNANPVELSGWGAYPRVECIVEQAETRGDIVRRLDHSGTIARGLGRSYGDAALNRGGQVLDLTLFNRYHAFNEDTGDLTCDAGVSLADIIRDFVPRGWFPAITPGTKYVTVGGCIANDIHGKAHHSQGSFANCVKALTILLADGTVVTANRNENADLFWANFGGMGLLGIILSATITLRRVETSYFHQKPIIVRDLEHLLEELEINDHLPYSVAWIDPLVTGARLGRGVLTVGDHARQKDLPADLAGAPLKIKRSPLFTVPIELPWFSLNPITLRILNAVISRVLANGASFAHYEKFFYPLDAVGHWYRGYGRPGFTQYQFVIPLEDGLKNMRALLETIAVSGQLPFLNVLKKLGPSSPGHLSFPFEGYTFAIDFPVRTGLSDLLSRLDQMVVDVGGRIYLGKDAFLSAPLLRPMYPRLDEWLHIKATVDPRNQFTSDLGRRVGLIPQ